jgi:hypothetical protein
VPYSQFNNPLVVTNGQLDMRGPLGEVEDDETAEVVVFVLVTQGLPHEDPVTVRGEVRMLAQQPNVVKRTAARWGVDGVRFAELANRWQISQAPVSGKLKSGKAYATGVRIEFKKDGQFETYAWSQWLDVKVVKR